MAVYLPPQTDAGTKPSLSQLYKEISKQETPHPEAALLVAGDFNAGKLKSVLPNLYQHVKCADAELQDCFAAQTGICSRDSSHGIEEYTTSVTGFINKCIEDVVPTVTARTYPNQKPWITGSIRTG